MECNIDQRGRKARLLTGIVVDLAGTVLLILGSAWDQSGLLIAGVVVTLVGIFVIFEGVKGWCALRALGFKTRM
jgi:hypothetical protein